MIINGELQTGLGGGVCQVSTTVFNAAYEAGLPITARTNHALYISHYPLGRDATVDYPDIDLKFVNDTRPLAAAPHVRRLVVARRDALRHAAAPPGRDRDGAAPGRRAAAGAEDSSTRRLAPGERRSSTTTASPRTSTSVHRLVYAPDGKLLSDATWYSNYALEPEDRRGRAPPSRSPSPRSRRRRRRLRPRLAAGSRGRALQ